MAEDILPIARPPVDQAQVVMVLPDSASVTTASGEVNLGYKEADGTFRRTNTLPVEIRLDATPSTFSEQTAWRAILGKLIAEAERLANEASP